MRIDILTLFTEMFDSPLSYSISGGQGKQQLVEIFFQISRFAATATVRSIQALRGGPGMSSVAGRCSLLRTRPAQAPEPGHVILLTPQGTPLSAACCRTNDPCAIDPDRRTLQGFDERIRTGLGAEQISIGDYVLSGGELAAMVLMDAVIRLLPGALGDEDSAADDSFSNGLLEYPQYTRPEEFRGMKVPEILLSGDYGKIKKWRTTEHPTYPGTGADLYEQYLKRRRPQ